MATVTDTTSTPITDLMATMNAKKPASTDGVSADTDKFMTLLVTQLQNQDPLNPLDNAQVTTQLAQISTVSGISQLNDTVAALGASMGISQYLQAANLSGAQNGLTAAQTGATTSTIAALNAQIAGLQRQIALTQARKCRAARSKTGMAKFKAQPKKPATKAP